MQYEHDVSPGCAARRDEARELRETEHSQPDAPVSSSAEGLVLRTDPADTEERMESARRRRKRRGVDCGGRESPPTGRGRRPIGSRRAPDKGGS